MSWRRSRRHDCAALGGAFDDAQNVLVAIRIDAERDDQHVAAHMDAIEHQNQQIQLAQWTTQKCFHASLRMRHKPSRDAGLARARSLDSLKVFQAAIILATRHPADDLLECAFLQWIVAAVLLPGRQHDLSAIQASQPRLLQPNPWARPCSNRLDSWPMPARLSVRAARVPQTTQKLQILLKHLAKRLQPKLHHQTQQRLTAAFQDLLESAPWSANIGLFLLILLSDTRSHDGDPP